MRPFNNVFILVFMYEYKVTKMFESLLTVGINISPGWSDHRLRTWSPLVYTWHQHASPCVSSDPLWSDLISPLYVQINMYIIGTKGHNVFFCKERKVICWIYKTTLITKNYYYYIGPQSSAVVFQLTCDYSSKENDTSLQRKKQLNVFNFEFIRRQGWFRICHRCFAKFISFFSLHNYKNSRFLRESDDCWSDHSGRIVIPGLEPWDYFVLVPSFFLYIFKYVVHEQHYVYNMQNFGLIWKAQ